MPLIQLLLLLVLSSISVTYGQNPNAALTSKLMSLTTQSEWVLTDSIVLPWNVHHTQGMVKVKEYYYISSVEIQERTTQYAKPIGGFDRSEGVGVGHIFKVDSQGNLLKDLQVGEGTMYHPSGLDFDGQYIWFAVAEYRPNSRSIIYRLNTVNDQVERLFEVQDHIGAVAFDKQHSQLIGGTWGAANFYRWKINSSKKTGLQQSKISRLARYIDFQDTKYLGNNIVFGSGIKSYTVKGKGNLVLGGWELINSKTLSPLWQLPILRRSPRGNSLVNNPCFIENHTHGILAYFLPDDDFNGVIYKYLIK